MERVVVLGLDEPAVEVDVELLVGVAADVVPDAALGAARRDDDQITFGPPLRLRARGNRAPFEGYHGSVHSPDCSSSRCQTSGTSESFVISTAMRIRDMRSPLSEGVRTHRVARWRLSRLGRGSIDVLADQRRRSGSM